eukprot:7880347-Prorocentrum_lima.AAC.1
MDRSSHHEDKIEHSTTWSGKKAPSAPSQTAGHHGEILDPEHENDYSDATNKAANKKEKTTKK